MKKHNSPMGVPIGFFLFLLTIAAPACVTLAGASAQKAILITGSNSGIGRKITEYLAGKGYFIYAGARHEADLLSLGAIENVQALRLDVTSSTDIAAAVDTVKKGGRGLYELINNAGIVTSATSSTQSRRSSSSS